MKTRIVKVVGIIIVSLLFAHFSADAKIFIMGPANVTVGQNAVYSVPYIPNAEEYIWQCSGHGIMSPSFSNYASVHWDIAGEAQIFVAVIYRDGQVDSDYLPVRVNEPLKGNAQVQEENKNQWDSIIYFDFSKILGI